MTNTVSVQKLDRHPGRIGELHRDASRASIRADPKARSSHSEIACRQVEGRATGLDRSG